MTDFEDDDFDESEDELHEDDQLNLQPGDARLLYDYVIWGIKKNAGIGFHINDQGNPIYAGGAMQIVDKVSLGEVPDECELFLLINRLADMISKDCQVGVKKFTWLEFCKMAVEASRRS